MSDTDFEDEIKPKEDHKELHIWAQRGTTFWPSTQQDQCNFLPAGIYEWGLSQQGWFLNYTRDRFVFPYKLYGVNNTGIMARIKMAWASKDVTNLGILMNGLKGTGKSVTAQMIANWMISQGYPVILVGSFVPNLGDVLARIKQPVALIFDEFEKSHQEKKHQQELLSVLDGMARTEHKRMFVFTTNDMSIDQNMVDRPSRVRYVFQFGRLTDDLIQELMDDLLDPDLAHLRPNVAAFINTRRVCSIDAAKTVIIETNFSRQAPEDFGNILNLSKRDMTGIRVSTMLPDGTEKVIREQMAVSNGNSFAHYTGKAGREKFAALFEAADNKFVITERYGSLRLELVALGKGDNEYLANVAPGSNATWYKGIRPIVSYLDDYVGDAVYLDAVPAGWEVPDWALELAALPYDAAMPDNLRDKMRDHFKHSTVYGGEEPARFCLKLEPLFETIAVHAKTYHPLEAL